MGVALSTGLRWVKFLRFSNISGEPEEDKRVDGSGARCAGSGGGGCLRPGRTGFGGAEPVGSRPSVASSRFNRCS